MPYVYNPFINNLDNTGSGGGGGGNVSGPGSSTDNAVVRWDGTSGTLIQNSTVIMDDSGNVSAIGNITPLTGSALRTATSAANTLLLQAYDVDGTSYTTFITLTANNNPSCAISGSTINNSVIGGVTPAAGSFTTLGASGTFTASAGQVVNTTTPGAYPYTILTSDFIICVDTGSARTINLPAAPAAKYMFHVKDNTGTGATTNNITVSGNGTNIDGAATSVINQTRDSRQFVFNGTQWNVI